jgi:hypothetical protein
MKDPNTIENQFISYVLKDNILYGTYKKDILIDTAAAHKIIEDRAALTKGNKYPLLLDTRFLKSITKEARDILASEESTHDMTAGAIIIDSYVTKTIGNFFLLINKPNVSAKLFNNTEDALKWIQQLNK